MALHAFRTKNKENRSPGGDVQGTLPQTGGEIERGAPPHFCQKRTRPPIERSPWKEHELKVEIFDPRDVYLASIYMEKTFFYLCCCFFVKITSFLNFCIQNGQTQNGPHLTLIINRL